MVGRYIAIAYRTNARDSTTLHQPIIFLASSLMSDVSIIDYLNCQEHTADSSAYTDYPHWCQYARGKMQEGHRSREKQIPRPKTTKACTNTGTNANSAATREGNILTNFNVGVTHSVGVNSAVAKGKNTEFRGPRNIYSPGN